ncbi:MULTISPECIES: thioesterase II family protein [Pseudomonadota]|uniref:thioesterase II family protein n=1 Tax=Pseudomonadota TaxID=1224 RepID=UPI0005DA41FD|nr:alpha/beta fold hydrolase [Achromobacter xylosoxidans]QPR94909.1 thioesterase [Achromobacter xylosoxidans]CKG97962.1 Surfactin synthase thioesterase subunit [Achromobacter xylosoxidans]
MADLMPLCATSEPCAEDTHLVLCPFAGGSASAFRSWRDLRPYGWQVWLAVYPGRDQRMNEACAASIAELADQVLMAIDTHQIAQQQLVIAGHSMGAQVAFEVCLRLEQRGSAPLGLVLSGCHAPHLHGRRLISHLEDRAFLEQLVAIGGNAQELLNEPGLWPVFMPMLRADFKATESYWHPQKPGERRRLQTPTLLIYGSADQEAWRSEVEAWKSWLSDVDGPVAIAGEHFYVTRRPRAFLEHIRRRFEPNSAHSATCAFK